MFKLTFLQTEMKGSQYEPAQEAIKPNHIFVLNIKMKPRMGPVSC